METAETELISWWVLRCISSRKLGSDCGLQSDQSWLLVQPGWLLSVNVTNSWNPEIVWVSYWGMNERRRSGTNGETQLRIPWCLRHPVSTIAPVRVDRLDRYIQSFNVRMRIGYCSLVPPPPNTTDTLFTDDEWWDWDATSVPHSSLLNRTTDRSLNDERVYYLRWSAPHSSSLIIRKPNIWTAHQLIITSHLVLNSSFSLPATNGIIEPLARRNHKGSHQHYKHH